MSIPAISRWTFSILPPAAGLSACGMRPPSIAMASQADRRASLILRLVNYGSPTRGDIMAQVRGIYNSATLLRPGQPPVTLRTCRRGANTRCAGARFQTPGGGGFQLRNGDMHLTRRDILRSGAALGTAALASRAPAAQQRYFTPHSFIEQNPKAVFIRRTRVAHKMDADAKRNEGLKLARLIFVGSDRPGHPDRQPHRAQTERHQSVSAGANGGGTLRHRHRSPVLRRAGHRAEGTRPHAVHLRRFHIVRQLELARSFGYQRPAGNCHAGSGTARAAFAGRMGDHLERGAGRRGLQAHSALRSGERTRHVAAQHRQVEGAQHGADAHREERAGPGCASFHQFLRRLAVCPQRRRML